MGKKRARNTGGGKLGKTVANKSKKGNTAPLPDEPDESDLEISEEDVHFVDEYSKRLGFLTSLNKNEIDKNLQRPKEKKVKEAPVEPDEAEEAEEYEQVPRQKLNEKERQRDRAAPLPLKVRGQLVYPDAKESAAAPEHAPVPQVAGITIEEAEEDGAEAEAGSPVVTSDDEDADSVSVTDEEEDGEHVSDVQATVKDSGEENDHSEGGEENSDRELDEEGVVQRRSEHQSALRDELKEFQTREERRDELKQQIALAATKLLEDPEQHLRELNSLVQLARDCDEYVARLAMLSLAAVFKDVLPGYRVRLPTEKELAMPISKDVKKVRDYESALLRSYQAYLKALLGACNAAEPRPLPRQAEQASPPDGVATAPDQAAAAPNLSTPRVAVRCLCMLLTSLPHFNHASDVLQAVVPRMGHRDEAMAAQCCSALGRLVASDAAGDGSAARDAVQLVADLVKLRRCVVRPEVVRVLLGLQLSSAVASDVKSGEQREYKSRKTRKKEKRARKGRGEDEVSAAFKEAQLGADAAQRRKTQSETLEALFEIFFRVLKHCTASGLASPTRTGAPVSEARCAKKFPLLAPALAGLSRYAHLISVEYFGDLLAVMVHIAAAPGLPPHTRLHVLLAASDILKGQGEALNVDRHELFQALHSALAAAPLAALEPLRQQPGGEPSAAASDQATADGPTCNGPRGGAAAAGPGSRNGQPGARNGPGGRSGQLRGRLSAADAAPEDLPFEVLLVRTAHQMLVEQSRALDLGRLAAFALRLSAVAQFLDVGGALGLLAVLERMLRQNHRLRGMLDAEPGGPVPPVPTAEDPHNLVEAARTALGAQMWQLRALSRSHPAAAVRQCAASVAAMPADGSASGHHIGLFARSDGPTGVAAAHSRPVTLPAGSPALSDADVAQLQGQLQAYYTKAFVAGEDERRQEECTSLAEQITESFGKLLPARFAEKRDAAAAAAAAKSAAHKAAKGPFKGPKGKKRGQETVGRDKKAQGNKQKKQK